jgi:hypothetical protein
MPSWNISNIEATMNEISNTPLSEYEIEDVKMEKKKTLLFKYILPTLAEAGQLELIKEIVNIYGNKLYFDMATAITKAGEEEYLGNAEPNNKLKPSDLHFDNLLHIAFRKGHDDMILFFVKELKKANMDPLDDAGIYEDELAYFIEEHAANLSGGRRKRATRRNKHRKTRSKGNGKHRKLRSMRR